MRYLLIPLALLLAGCEQLSQPSSPQAGAADHTFRQLADEYVSGYLAWRPLTGTALGLHQYDGKVTDYSKGSLAGRVSPSHIL